MKKVDKVADLEARIKKLYPDVQGVSVQETLNVYVHLKKGGKRTTINPALIAKEFYEVFPDKNIGVIT